MNISSSPFTHSDTENTKCSETRLTHFNIDCFNYVLGLQHEARGHIFKLPIYYKNYTIIKAVKYTTYVIFPHAVSNAAHNNGHSPLPQTI